MALANCESFGSLSSMSRDELPNDIYQLKNLVLDLHNKVVEKEIELLDLSKKNAHLQDLINLLQKRKFAP